MIRKLIQIALILIPAIFLAVSCAGGDRAPVEPAVNSFDQDHSSRQLWGIWDVEVIPDGSGSAEVIFEPARQSQVHMNVVGLVESGGGAAVGVEPPVVVEDSILDVDIRLTHPFDIDRFTGFDVRGILIGHGSYGGFSESLFYAGPNDMELMNADGHTSLWNPTDYKGSGYRDGKLGTPDAIANFTATLNGYKYFSDDLTPNMSVSDMLTTKRGAFGAGMSNVRHYTIRLGDKGLSFQYAIDANWWKPTEPVEIPDSFDVERANCPEPYHLDLWVGPGITRDGGSADFHLDVYDWQKDVTTVFLEAPLLTDDVMTLEDPEDFGDYVRFTGTLSNDNLPDFEQAEILVYARGVDPVSSTTYTDYHLYHLPLAAIPDGGVVITVQDDMSYKTIGNSYEYGGSSYDYSVGNAPPVDYEDHDGVWDFTGIPNDESGIREVLDKTDPEVAPFAGDFSPHVTHFFKTQWLIEDQTRDLYQAESHNEDARILRLWGIYEEQDLEGSVPFDPPIDFEYPMDIDTHYSVDREYTVIPILLTLKISYETWGIGEGVAFVPVEPGVNGWGWDTQASLETRTVLSMETGGVLGEGPLGTALIYEWIADDGTVYGTITSGNAPDEDPNFDEETYEITGSVSALALRSSS